MSDSIPEEARRLIAERINSVEQLEVLLLLRKDEEREWCAEEVSDELRSSPTSAARRLADLFAHDLLAMRQGSNTLYRYCPGSETLRRAVDALARAYAERRFTVIDMIFSKPVEKLRVFADAFRVREDDSSR